MKQNADSEDVAGSEAGDTSLAGDQRGAIMVMGIFMAMLMVGFIYYVAGLGETILFRERVQDASDAAAWSSAVLHARGMNIVALINMIMSSIAAVLLALNMLIAALKVAILIGEVLQAIPFTAPVGAAIVGVAEPLKQAVETCRDSVKEITDEVLPLLTKANRAVRAAIPVVAELKVVAMVRETYRDTADFGMFYGKTLLPEPTLPLEDDQCERLEEHGEEVINGLLRGVLGNGVLADIMEKVMDALGTVASYSEGSLCGAGSHGGPDSAAATTQVLGEECADNPAISTETLAQCISAGQMFCWGSSSSNDYPHYDDMGVPRWIS